MIVVTGTAAVVLIGLGVAIYLLEFAGKTAQYKDRRSGYSRYGNVDLAPTRADQTPHAMDGEDSDASEEA
jgi:hypothetical protein